MDDDKVVCVELDWRVWFVPSVEDHPRVKEINDWLREVSLEHRCQWGQYESHRGGVPIIFENVEDADSTKLKFTVPHE